MAIKAVLFDNDGTLVDTHDLLLNCFRHATREVLGEELPEHVLMAKVGQPLAVQMRDFSDDPEVQAELCRVYRERNEVLHDEAISLFPGTVEALARLQEAGLAMGVVTSKMHAIAQRGLNVLGVGEYFDCLVGADDCSKHKPDPAPVAYGCELLGVSPEECVYVGDSPFDMHAGNGAGCVTAGVLWGMFSEERLREENPAMVCATCEELADAILALKIN